jgi:PAS domain S-box-containing protein
MTRPALRRLLPIVLLALVYYAAGRLGLLLAFAGSNASPVWPPSGIAFGALLIYGLRLWPGVFLGAVGANLAVFLSNDVLAPGPALLVSCLIGAGNTLEALAGAWLLRRVAGRDVSLLQIQNVYKFSLIAACVCAISALVGTAALLVAGIVPLAAGWTVLGTWWVGDLAGVLVIAPALLAWRKAQAADLKGMFDPERLLSLAGLGLLLMAIFGHQYGTDGGDRWLAYLLLPVVAWCAVRHGKRGTTLVCLAVATSAVAGTTAGLGPFATGTLNDALFAIQTFVALCSLLGMVLCADLHEMRGRHPDSPVRHRLTAHWATLFACLGMTVLVWQLVAGATEHRARERFESAAGAIEQRIVERMRTYEQGLLGARALFGASVSVERAEWRAFIDGMGVDRNYPGVQGIGYASLIPSSERAALEQSVRADGYPAFRIWPAESGARSLPVIYLEPFNQLNQRAFGYDLLAEPTRRAAVERAVVSGLPALTDRVTLLQDERGPPQAGFLMIVPVYRNGAPLASSAQRRAAFQGVISSPFRMSDLMAGILAPGSADVGLEIFDGVQALPAQRMYASALRSAQDLKDYPNPFQVQMPVRLQQHQWTIRVTSLAAFETSIDRQKSQIVLVAGAIISMLFFGVVRALAAREEYAAARAEQMRSALAESERKFETLVDSAIAFAIIATDLAGVIRVFSTGAVRMLGYAPEDMIGKQTLAMFHEPAELAAHAAALRQEHGLEADGVDVLLAAAREGRAEQREWTYVQRDGERVPVSLVVTAIHDGAGAVVGFLGVAHNIARQQDLQASLVRAKELAEAASRAKTEFVANMSHEIRTPMNAVLGISHLLGKTQLAPGQRHYLDMIRTAGQSLLGIINDVLDFSKIEAGRMELAPEPFELDSVLDNCASLMTVNAGEKELELVVAAAPGLPRRLVGDALRLQQVLANLLSNAIKFTERGEVSLFAEEEARNGDLVTIRFVVSDTGIGIDAAQQQKLFSPFTQADASMTRRFGGTGLGLTITKNLVDLMDGSIAIDSAGAGGSRFSVSLPFKVIGGAAAPHADALQGLRLLVVDDSATSRRGLAACAEACGWQATLFGSGTEALGHLGSFGRAAYPYDAMLVDAGMPGMDGIETVRAAQRFMGERALPFVLMTRSYARDGLEARIEGAVRGVTLVKPVTPDSLAAALHSVLAPAPVSSQGRAAGAEAALAALRILLVEDNELNQVVARGFLGAEGARVVVANNGEEALAILRRDSQFDLVLMDVQMPVLDGLATTRMLRSELKLDLPVIAMSAGVMASERAQCIEAGMNDFIAKPLDPALMLGLIKRHVGVTPRRAQTPPAAPVAAQMVADVFDIGALVALNERHPERRNELFKLIERALAAAAPQLAAAHLAWQRGDIDNAARSLHNLRGAIGTVGARRFMRLSLELEGALRESDPNADLAQLFAQAGVEVQSTVDAGEAWLASAKQ